MRSFARLVIGALLLASTMPAVLAQSSQSQRIYNEALERERTLRKELEAPGAGIALLTRLRALVGAYEDVSKLFPGSDYADNALWQGALIGVLTVSKPTAALMPYAERARGRVMNAGFVLLGISAAIGLLFTLWLTWSLNRLRDYANALAAGDKPAPPEAAGRQLTELARALATMRERLDGKQYVERYVQDLAHELKSPLSAVRGAAELLQEDPGAEDRRRFAANVAEQSERMQRIIERLLALWRDWQLPPWRVEH